MPDPATRDAVNKAQGSDETVESLPSFTVASPYL